MKRTFALVTFCAISSATLVGQALCPKDVPSDKLICVIPQAFGISQTLAVGSNNQSQFSLDTLNRSLSSLNSSTARSSALLPLASPSSGITFLWDPAAKIFAPSTDSLGPILGERADTIGRYRVSLGVSYQLFQFDSLDGISLKHLPVVITQPPDSSSVGGRTCAINGDNTTQCAYIRDVITTNTRVDLRVHQVTTFITFGLTNRLDVSVAIPIENVRMGASSTATIVDNAHSGIFSFPIVDNVCGSDTSPCLTNSFSNVKTASGIGDITVRVKGTAFKGERAGLALGVDIRTPTGDALNFLGSGAAGFKPFVIWSYRSRVSPHVAVGYETNGSSLIAGDISEGTKARLPGQLTYSAGADVWVTKRLTANVDIVGEEVFQAERTKRTTTTEPGACLDTSGTCDPALGFAPPQTDPSVSPSTGTFNTTNSSVGIKWRPFRSNLVFTANGLIPLTHGGLRSKVVPLVGISYTF